MNSVAILITVFNRKEQTLACLDSVVESLKGSPAKLDVSIFLTDDGSTDGTTDAIQERHYPMTMHVQEAAGSLFWNGGMIHSWRAAMNVGGFDGFLWLNNDTIVQNRFWKELVEADNYSRLHFNRGGIYVGSTCSRDGKTYTYGGFNFVNYLTLKDEFVKPNGRLQSCQCAHGNLTFVSSDVAKIMGIFTDEYIHSGGDHDYTYRAYKRGLPILVLPSFVGICENDHPEDGYADFLKMTLKERIQYLKSPLGFNLHNTLVFQRRCFPYRYPFVWVMGYLKALFPKTYWRIYQLLRH